jgi:hypothetical protein
MLTLNNEFISGEKITSLADVSIYSKEYLNKYHNSKKYCNNIIYVGTEMNENIIKLIDTLFTFFIKPDWLEYFIDNILPHIKHKFILLTHNSDLTVGLHNEILNNKFLIKWMGQNSIVHPKMDGIPIGLENSFFKGWDYKICHDNYNNIKDKLLYINFNTKTNKIRNNILDTLIKEGFTNKITRIEWREYIKELSNHKFCIAPPGNGVDTHRIWEAIYVGCIPIVINNDILYNYFNELPILWTNDYTEINKEYLYKIYSKLKKKEYNMDKIKLDYWRNKINSYKNLV